MLAFSFSVVSLGLPHPSSSSEEPIKYCPYVQDGYVIMNHTAEETRRVLIVHVRLPRISYNRSSLSKELARHTPSLVQSIDSSQSATMTLFFFSDVRGVPLHASTLLIVPALNTYNVLSLFSFHHALASSALLFVVEFTNNGSPDAFL